jgi:hypothetical protein
MGERRDDRQQRSDNLAGEGVLAALADPEFYARAKEAEGAALFRLTLAGYPTDYSNETDNHNQRADRRR